VLDEFRAMRPYQVEAGEINWGLNYPGKKFRFMEEYLRELGQVRAGEGSDGEGRIEPPSSSG
jgi:3-dehydroquinate synthase class II